MNAAEVFAFDRSKLDWPLGVALAVALVLPLVVLAALDRDVYWLSLSFGVLLCGLSDPGGSLRTRYSHLGVFALVGAVLTLWGTWVGAEAWGLVAASTLVVVFASGLVIRFGVHRFIAGAMLATWFLIAISLPPGFAADGVTLHPWWQAVAWLVGAALWIVTTFVLWLVRGRVPHPQPVAELPSDTTITHLSRPVVLYAGLRAVAVAGAVAVAFGFDLPYADWMPVAALVAMKPTLRQSAVVATQRFLGTVLGAALAIVLLLAIDDVHALEVILVVLVVVAGALRPANYALYSTAVAGAVLIGLDLPDPGDFATEGRRVLFTLAGVVIALAVMGLAGLLARRGSPRPAGTPATV